jgi:hypothetical protein
MPQVVDNSFGGVFIMEVVHFGNFPAVDILELVYSCFHPNITESPESLFPDHFSLTAIESCHSVTSPRN